MLFAKGGKTVENVPLMLNPLKQHIKQSAFQAIKWSQCLIKNTSFKFRHGVGKQQS